MIITKCYNCGCKRSVAYFDAFGARLQKTWLKFFVKTVYLCQDCYSNPQNFGIIVKRFYNAGLKL